MFDSYRLAGSATASRQPFTLAGTSRGVAFIARPLPCPTSCLEGGQPRCLQQSETPCRGAFMHSRHPMIACLLPSTASCGAGLLLQQGKHAVHIVLAVAGSCGQFCTASWEFVGWPCTPSHPDGGGNMCSALVAPGSCSRPAPAAHQQSSTSKLQNREYPHLHPVQPLLPWVGALL